MSTGPRRQAAVLCGNQNKVDCDAPQSALFYLLQEVSMLASPKRHNSLLDANPPSRRPNETSRTRPLVVKKEDEDASSVQTSDTSCHRSLLYDQVKSAEEERRSAVVTPVAEPHCECHSPWKVLSLINLHCERLLHHTDVEALESSSASSKPGQLTAKLSTAAPAATEGRGVECMVNERRHVTASVSPADNVTWACTGSGRKLQPCLKDSEVGCSVQLQTAERTDAAREELLEDSATACLQSQQRGKREVKFSVNGQLVWHQECQKHCSSAENALLQTHIPNARLNAQLTFNHSEADVARSKPALTLDHNANLMLSTEPPCGTQQPPLSSALPSSQLASLTCSTAESCHSLSTRGGQITASELDCARAAESPSAAHEALQKDGLPSIGQWRTKTPRKQAHPCRSADIQDPDFQGVTFRMDAELDDSREQCRLLITSKYSKELCKSVRKPRLRARTSQKSLKASSSDEENDLTANGLKGKACASCCTRKTPMWRDAEDGTPLCNACGIRYKKYRVRCVNCWHIPRKEGNSNSCCLKCGNFVRLTSAQRKHAT